MRAHFVGCEGVSMKMLRRLSEKKGYITSGSDISLTGHDAKNVAGADFVVYNAAIPPCNPELLRAGELGIRTVGRSDYLAEICDGYDFSIAVAGTHGKTTTTAMLWEVLLPLDPTVHIGGDYKGENGRIGGEKLFVTEACEYKRGFLNLSPDVAVVLNADLDHTDCYRDAADAECSFLEFARRAKKLAVVPGDGGFVTTGLKNYMTVGLEKSNDYHPAAVKREKGRYSFCVFNRGENLGRISLNVAGRHNMLNALFCVAASLACGLSFKEIAEGLARFKGVTRRTEYLGSRGAKQIFSDYAHHPREITATLTSARESGYKNIIAVFEPHTYTRTQSFFKEFAAALHLADRVVLLPVFAARENPIDGADSHLIASELKNRGKPAVLCDGYEAATEYLNKYLNADLKKNGLVLFMGAGTIDNLAREFAKGY